MDNQARIARLKEKEYRKIFGVTKPIFEQMLGILEKTFQEEHRRGGHPPKLSVLDKLIIMLCYYREYRTMESIAFDYGVTKSTVYESIRWAEESLMKSNNFSLPSKKALIEDLDIEVVFVDATECEIERPQKNKSVTTPERKKDTRWRFSWS